MEQLLFENLDETKVHEEHFWEIRFRIDDFPQ